MSLDLSKLENVQEHPEKTTARCPACAQAGNDNKGNHLAIFPNDEYTCAVFQGDTGKEHRRLVWHLAGMKDCAKEGPPARIKVTPHPDLNKWMDYLQRNSEDHRS